MFVNPRDNVSRYNCFFSLGIHPIWTRTGRPHPKGELLFRFQKYERVWISLLEIYERVGNLSLWSVKGRNSANRRIIWLCYEKDKKTSWFSDLFIFKRRCTHSS